MTAAAGLPNVLFALAKPGASIDAPNNRRAECLGRHAQGRSACCIPHSQYLTWLVTGGLLQLVLGLFFLAIPWFVFTGLSLADRLFADDSCIAALGNRHDVRFLPQPEILHPLLLPALRRSLRLRKQSARGRCQMRAPIYFDLTEALLP